MRNTECLAGDRSLPLLLRAVYGSLKVSLLLALGLFSASAAAIGAETFKPTILYQGSIEQNSFNQTIHEGVKAFSDKTGVSCSEIVVGLKQSEYMSSLEEVCLQGASPVFLIYGNHIQGLGEFIRRYPAIRFVALGAVVDQPNLFSLNFAEEEGSFLAGALAAMKTKSRIIGFVSVADLPLMRRFSCGYEQGARYVDPDVKVLVGFIGGYVGAWFDGTATAKMANGMMDQGADVIYQAAGGAGEAVLEAAAKRGMLGIGVDRNQNGLFPGHVLTSMLKRSDKVIYAALVQAQRGIWRDNIKRFGLAQDAVDLAFDGNNAPLISKDQRARLDAIRTKILRGEIKVHDYVSDNACP